MAMVLACMLATFNVASASLPVVFDETNFDVQLLQTALSVQTQPGTAATQADLYVTGDRGTNPCPSGSAVISQDSCLSAVQAELPAGQNQGRTNLVSGSWGHVPPGCSVQSGGDWAAHYNSNGNGNNDGGYSPVCQVSSYVVGDRGGNSCPSGSAAIDQGSCLSAVQTQLPAGQNQGRTNLVSGSWGHVPPGCSVQSGGDWAAHYNSNGNGNNDGGYSPVCQACPPHCNYCTKGPTDWCEHSMCCYQSFRGVPGCAAGYGWNGGLCEINGFALVTTTCAANGMYDIQTREICHGSAATALGYSSATKFDGRWDTIAFGCYLTSAGKVAFNAGTSGSGAGNHQYICSKDQLA